MDVRKTFATAVVAIMLGLQLFAITPLGGDGWYWPFMNYPMYSRAHYPGEALTFLQLRVRGCDSAAASSTVVVQPEDLRLRRARYRRTLARAVGEGPGAAGAAAQARAMRLLGGLVRGRWPGVPCRAEIWAREYRNGQSGADLRGVRWRLRQSWPLPAPAAGECSEAGRP